MVLFASCGHCFEFLHLFAKGATPEWQTTMQRCLDAFETRRADKECMAPAKSMANAAASYSKKGKTNQVLRLCMFEALLV